MGLDSFRSGDVEGANEEEDLGEVGRLFPTIEFIGDEEIVEGVKNYVDDEVPGYFWKAPATSSDKYHHPLSRERRGLWTHTLMVATGVEVQKWTYVEMGKLSHYEMDCARAAALLHDTKKYGGKFWPGKSADKDHDLQAARAVRRTDGLPDLVAECIESHMGPSYAGPEPGSHLDMVVHMADVMASTPDNEARIYKPPQELIDVHGTVPEATQLR